MKYILIVLIICFSSCVTDGNTVTTVTLNNRTPYTIKLFPYKGHNLDTNKVKIINPQSSLKIESLSELGKSKKPIYFFDYFRNIDSIQVIWNDSFLVTHMISDTFYSNNKFIQFSILGQNRNLGSGSNYLENKVKESKHSITWDVVYTFSEADYNFAKD